MKKTSERDLENVRMEGRLLREKDRGGFRGKIGDLAEKEGQRLQEYTEGVVHEESVRSGGICRGRVKRSRET